MSDEHEEYLAVLKASYDYQPQSEDEIAITDGQILLLKERVDEDWWKVKIKGDSQDEDSPIGLVPAAYIEQADHTSLVKVLYDYEAAASGELSVQEDEILLVFETEEDWILAQSQKEGGKAGFVPGNYVEPYSEEPTPPPPRIIVPPSAPRPVSTYIDPADRVASAKVTADGIKTWSVSEIDKKGKKKKGTLGIGNGAVFFASESDKTPVQKWQTVDVQSATSEKAKHVNIDIGGASPITLHFHAGSKDNVEEIISKMKSSRVLSAPQTPLHESHDDNPTQPPSPEPEPVNKKPSVHFSNNLPVIIPARDDAGGSSEEDEPHANGTSVNGNGHSVSHGSSDSGDIGTALYDFAADGDDELSISEGEDLVILERDGDEWWKCRNSSGKEGVVPASYIELSASAASVPAVLAQRVVSPPPSPPIEDDEDIAEAAAEAEKQRAEDERAAREKERQRKEQEKKKAEAQRRAKEAAEKADLEREQRKRASSSQPALKLAGPPVDRTRIWHDRSGQFRVEAAFLGFSNGKLRLHKVNGVIVEVPSEKMSVEDMKYVERLTSKKSRPPPTDQMSEDDIPLGLSRPEQKPSRSAPPKAAPKIDWFDFFLSAGCDLDDCTRYAAAFEKDKLDETLLPDISEGIMRTLGVREGDIIRIKKAIEKRNPTDNLHKPSAYTQEQVRRDEDLARQLQAQESGGARTPAPNLFSAGPGGLLKTQSRRTRPTPSKSLPPSAVDLNVISTVSDQIQRTSSPQIMTPTSAPVSSNAAIAPPRSSSAAPAVSGFDDDAWTIRPSSTKPLVGPPAPRVPSAPPVQPAAAKPPTPAPAVAPAPTTSTKPTTSLAQTTESDVFEQLARYGEFKKQAAQATPMQPPPSTSPPIVAPSSFQAGLGMGSSPSPMGQLLQTHLTTHQQQPPYNGPRGPFAPVPANQSLLQPLIPTQTGFGGMIPTRAGPSVSPFANNSSPSFLHQQPTGFPLQQQPLMSQPTGMPLNGFNNMQTSPFTPIQSHIVVNALTEYTGFNPNFGQSPFNNPSSPSPFSNSSPPVPPLPSTTSAATNTSPANIFAQMKSGTFATDNNTNIQPQPGTYDESTIVTVFTYFNLSQSLLHSQQDGVNPMVDTQASSVNHLVNMIDIIPG
ncbi:hypothetical protein C0991_001187 [Blastosporella zonata]|nr:hypothetical protein C0991_001187 [Blastosporella zonata]